MASYLLSPNANVRISQEDSQARKPRLFKKHKLTKSVKKGTNSCLESVGWSRIPFRWFDCLKHWVPFIQILRTEGTYMSRDVEIPITFSDCESKTLGFVYCKL